MATSADQPLSKTAASARQTPSQPLLLPRYPFAPSSVIWKSCWDAVGIDVESVGVAMVVLGVEQYADQVSRSEATVPRDHPRVDILGVRISHKQADV